MFSTSKKHGKRLLAAVGITALATTAAVVSVSASASGNAKQSWETPNSGPNPTVVLVHGAWADSSSWDQVVRLLQEDGYTVDVPPNPLRGLASDSAYLADYLHSVEGPIVLVGHSYGGAVITDAALGNTQVKALVYIDAFIPDEGQSVNELARAKPGSCLAGGGNPANVFNRALSGRAPWRLRPVRQDRSEQRVSWICRLLGNRPAPQRGCGTGCHAATDHAQRANRKVWPAGVEASLVVLYRLARPDSPAS